MSDSVCDDLIDIAGVAELLEMKADSARTLILRSVRSSHPFPEPCVRLGGRPGWRECDIREWISGRPGAGRGPRPGRRLSDEQRLAALSKGKPYLSSAAAAKFFRMTLDQFEALPKRRRPRATIVGKYTRYTLDDLRDWIQETAA